MSKIAHQKTGIFYGFEKALEAQKITRDVLKRNPNATTMDIAAALLTMTKNQGSGDLNAAEKVILDIYYYAAQRLRPLVMEKLQRSKRAPLKEVISDSVAQMRRHIAKDLLSTTFAVARAAKSLPANMLEQGKANELLSQYFTGDDIVPHIKELPVEPK